MTYIVYLLLYWFPGTVSDWLLLVACHVLTTIPIQMVLKKDYRHSSGLNSGLKTGVCGFPILKQLAPFSWVVRGARVQDRRVLDAGNFGGYSATPNLASRNGIWRRSGAIADYAYSPCLEMFFLVECTVLFSNLLCRYFFTLVASYG